MMLLTSDSTAARFGDARMRELRRLTGTGTSRSKDRSRERTERRQAPAQRPVTVPVAVN